MTGIVKQVDVSSAPACALAVNNMNPLTRMKIYLSLCSVNLHSVLKNENFCSDSLVCVWDAKLFQDVCSVKLMRVINYFGWLWSFSKVIIYSTFTIQTLKPTMIPVNSRVILISLRYKGIKYTKDTCLVQVQICIWVQGEDCFYSYNFISKLPCQC